jgi:hypothetical protein
MASPGSWRNGDTVLAATPGCCGGAGTGEGMWRWGPPRGHEGSVFAPIPQPADAVGPDVLRGRLENPNKFLLDSTESHVEDDEFLLFGGEMGVRMDSGGGEGLERLAASREGRRLDFFGNSLLKYGMMDEWTAG